MNKGFTLIESLLYIALFAIIIGGALVAVYQMIESSDAVSAKNNVEMEGSFLLRKIDWALTGAKDIGSPSVNNSGQVLGINFTTPSPLIFRLNSDKLQLSRDNGITFSDLSSDYVVVSDVLFTHTDSDYVSPTSPGPKPAEIKASFDIATKAEPSKTYPFETTKYLRK